MLDPEAGAGTQQGLQTASLRSWESLQLLGALEAEAGSDQVLARVGEGTSVALDGNKFLGKIVEWRIITERHDIERVYLALTRVLLNSHFLSDVLVGAGVGLIVTREVLVYVFPQLMRAWF